MNKKLKIFFLINTTVIIGLLGCILQVYHQFSPISDIAPHARSTVMRLEERWAMSDYLASLVFYFLGANIGEILLFWLLAKNNIISEENALAWTFIFLILMFLMSIFGFIMCFDIGSS
jgi:uncharacterized protein YacL